MEELSKVLYKKSYLLILDNFEHLINESPVVTELLQATHNLKILVTSREVLSIKGEHVYPVEGFDWTNSEHPFEETAAYRTFLHNAQAIYPHFSPNAHDIQYIRRICQIVGGMPLAIEMASGWISMLTVEEISERLGHSTDLLAIDEQDRPERQRNIERLFDYTFELLPAKSAEVMLALGVFHAEGFTFAAANSVAGATLPIMKTLKYLFTYP